MRPPFNRYLYEIVVDELKNADEVNITSVINRIPNFGPKIYGQPTNEHFLKGNYYTLAQLLDFQPTPAQVTKAIDMVMNAAKSEHSHHNHKEE